MRASTATSQQPISVLFLGSFLEYSATVLQALHNAPELEVVGVVTTPPKPAGRKKILKKTDVHQLAEQLDLQVFAPEKLTEESLQQLLDQLGEPPQILLTAGYGKLLPASWLEFPTVGALNLHFSLLPAYRGANPAEWALLKGEIETGVSVITMAAQFDTGGVISRASYTITSQDTRESVYDELYTLGGEILPQVVVDFVNGALSVEPQPKQSPTPYAKRFNRDDGFIDWQAIVSLMEGKTAATDLVSPLLATALYPDGESDTITALDVERATRGLAGFPGLWTNINTTKGVKRMKILETDEQNGTLILKKVQIAGQDAAQWNQVKNILHEN
jgi:methionyl-tRNA formyltransferase